MEQQEFQNWLSGTDNLTKAQRHLKALSGRNERDDSLAATEQGMDEDLICPHCGEPGAARLGKNRGSASVSVRRLRADIQLADRNIGGQTAQEGQMA